MKSWQQNLATLDINSNEVMIMAYFVSHVL
jgi:hypothetical protein